MVASLLHVVTQWGDTCLVFYSCKSSAPVSQKTVCVEYKEQSVSYEQEKNSCLLWDAYDARRCSLWQSAKFLNFTDLVHKITPWL